jgi:hypothetical protein
VKGKYGRICSTYGEKRNAYRILVRKPERKRQLRRPRHKWEFNFKMYPRETGWSGVVWSGFFRLRIESSDRFL